MWLSSLGMPSFVKTPEDQIGISGGVASFVCLAAGEPKPRITWMKKGKKVSSQRFEVIEFDDGSGSVLRIQPLRTHRDEAIYECTATNSMGEINTSAKLTVLEEDQIPHGFPTIDMGPQLKVVEKTRTATMLCAASGNPDPEISWFKDFLPVDVASSNGRIKQLRSEDQIPHGFPTIDMGPQLKVVEKTRTATMLCAASGNPDPEISWFKDFLPVDVASSNGRIKQLRSGSAHRYHPYTDSGAAKTSTRCPPTRVPSADHFFFTLQTHHAATQELQRRRTIQLWAVYRKARRRLARLQGSLPSTVSNRIAWTRTVVTLPDVPLGSPYPTFDHLMA
ncbi:UNVERIFIED_CONTAM: hypothetical protein FKN15_064916 [Acipenser sinensis]